MSLEQAVAGFQQFCGEDLTSTLARIESSIRGVSAERLEDALAKRMAQRLHQARIDASPVFRGLRPALP